MNSFVEIFLLAMTLVAAWFAWRYYLLIRRLNEYAELLRRSPQSLPTDLNQIENLSNAIASLKNSFELRLTAMDSDNARLSTVLEQLTDGVLIADANGQVQYANPAAEKLFEADAPIHHSVAEVVPISCQPPGDRRG